MRQNTYQGTISKVGKYLQPSGMYFSKEQYTTYYTSFRMKIYSARKTQ